MGSDPIVHEEPEAEVVSDESDSVGTDIENTASEVEDINASTNTEPQALQHSSETAPSAELINSIVEVDEETGQTNIKIPVANKETVSNVLQLLGKLFGGI